MPNMSYFMESRILGSLLGLFVGDALGATLEFKSSQRIAAHYPDGLWDMIGGGPHNTSPGQIADDGELAIALLRSLVTTGGEYDSRKAFVQYRYWLESGPFDCGSTIRSGLNGEHNRKSEANGALMRVAPIALVGWLRPVDIVAQWAKDDARLTHVNAVCVDANEFFVRIMHYGLNCPDRNLADLRKTVKTFVLQIGEKSVPWIKAIVEKAERGEPTSDYLTNQGHVVISLHNAIYHLFNTDDFENAIVDTVMRGGDTDTNAAICGALLGGIFGKTEIPERWRSAVISSAPKNRSNDWWPKTGVSLLYQACALEGPQ
jgi:ADP-ribosylglycohydrolase